MVEALRRSSIKLVVTRPEQAAAFMPPRNLAHRQTSSAANRRAFRSWTWSRP